MAVFRETKGRAKDKLPLEHMSLDSDLSFFLEIFYNLEVIDYHCDGFYASVMLDNNRKLKLAVNIEKLKEFPINEQIYILIHEGGHIVFNHLLRGEHWENREAANIAADAVLNSILDKHYPQVSMPKVNNKKIGITLQLLESEGLIKQEDLDLLDKDLDELTTDDVYEILLKNSKGSGKGNGQGNTCPNCGKNTDKTPDTSPSSPESPDKCPHCGEDLSKSLDRFDKQRLDSHNDSFTADDLDDETRTQIEELIRQAKSDMYGSKTGSFIRDLMKVVRKRFPFKQILDKIIYKEKYDFSREHRRLKIPNGYLPRKSSEKIKVYAMIDVSGSVYDYTEDFIGYIMALEEFEELIFIDTQILQVFKKGDAFPKVVPGGGGTDLNPGFSHWAEIEQSNRGSKLNFVCLTDGEIPPLTAGPIKSKVVILTTNEPVNYENSIRPYMNIKINKGDYE
ncbi:MAG: hypothetical protein NC816_00795 [Candidatus Omnitrophica bacterium]|nr:hypothetical protein [Candidatus Omnitrophota bacterium]